MTPTEVQQRELQNWIQELQHTMLVDKNEEHRMTRVSSCYFSIPPEENQDDEWLESSGDTADASPRKSLPLTRTDSNDPAALGPLLPDPSDWQHCCSDIIGKVVGYLDHDSLRAVSETDKRLNQECYHYLRTKLQLAISCDEGDDEELSPDTAVLARLAHLDAVQAQDVVNAFVDERSHSSELRAALVRPYYYALPQHLHHYFQHVDDGADGDDSTAQPSTRLTKAAAALLLTFLGGAAAAYHHQQHHHAGEVDMPLDPQEMARVFFQLGCLGSLLKTMSYQAATCGLPFSYAQELRRILHMEQGLYLRFVQAAHDSAVYKYAMSGRLQEAEAVGDDHSMEQGLQHLNEQHDVIVTDAAVEGATAAPPCYTGCVGAYARALQESKKLVQSIVRMQRQARFDALSPHQQKKLSRRFLDACSTDDTLAVVQDLVQFVDVDGFYVGSDGSETCALHAAAFSGATQVLDFLCRGICESLSPTEISTDPLQRDGGLCNVNRRDRNGWTALHFCAGSDSAPAVRVLARNGADLNVEARNGYTPLQWALRMQNQDAADELRRQNRKEASAWLPGQPFTALANRFMALMPTVSA
jgi:hypothetical protein